MRLHLRTPLEDNSLALEHAATCWAEARTDEESSCCMALIDVLLDERSLLQQIERNDLRSGAR